MSVGKKILYYSISTFLFLCSVFKQTTAFSITGFIGFIFATFVVLFLSYKLTGNMNDQHDKHIAIIVLFVSLIYLILSFANISIAFSRIGVMVYSLIFVICGCWKYIFKAGNPYNTMICILFAGAILLFSFYVTNNIGFFSPDSYGYYDISKTFWSDFGKIKTIRQYSIETTYNTSFPYLFPFFVWLLNLLTGLEIYSGVLFNLYLVIITGAILFRLSKEYTGHLYFGIVLFSLLLVNKEYLEEVIAARSIPLAICIICVLAYFALKCVTKNDTNKQVTYIFVIGILSGAYLATRQDGLPLIPYTIVILLFASKRIKNIIVYLIGFIIAYLPQLLYSLVNFGKFFTSDNSGTFLRVESTNWIALPGEVKTLFNVPQEWLNSFLHKIANVFISLIKCSYPGDILILLCCVAIIIALAKRRIRFSDIKDLIVVLLFYIGKTAMYMLVGYSDVRYHVETVLMISMVCMYTCYHCGVFDGFSHTSVNDANSDSTGAEVLFAKYRTTLIGICVFCVLLSCYSLRSNAKTFLINYGVNDFKQISMYPSWISDLEYEIEELGVSSTDKIMVIGTGSNPYAFGSYSERYVYAMPGGVTLQQANYIIDKYGDINYVLVQDIPEYSDIAEHMPYELNTKLNNGWYLIKVE